MFLQDLGMGSTGSDAPESGRCCSKGLSSSPSRFEAVPPCSWPEAVPPFPWPEAVPPYPLFLSRSKPPLSRSKPPLVQETGFFVVGGGPAYYCWSQNRPLGPDGRAPPPPAFAHAPGPHWLPTCQNTGTHPAHTLAVLLLPLPRLPLSRQLVSIWLCSAWAKLLVFLLRWHPRWPKALRAARSLEPEMNKHRL